MIDHNQIFTDIRTRLRDIQADTSPQQNDLTNYFDGMMLTTFADLLKAMSFRVSFSEPHGRGLLANNAAFGAKLQALAERNPDAVVEFMGQLELNKAVNDFITGDGQAIFDQLPRLVQARVLAKLAVYSNERPNFQPMLSKLLSVNEFRQLDIAFLQLPQLWEAVLNSDHPEWLLKLMRVAHPSVGRRLMQVEEGGDRNAVYMSLRDRVSDQLNVMIQSVDVADADRLNILAQVCTTWSVALPPQLVEKMLANAAIELDMVMAAQLRGNIQPSIETLALLKNHDEAVFSAQVNHWFDASADIEDKANISSVQDDALRATLQWIALQKQAGQYVSDVSALLMPFGEQIGSDEAAYDVSCRLVGAAQLPSRAFFLIGQVSQPTTVSVVETSQTSVTEVMDVDTLQAQLEQAITVDAVMDLVRVDGEVSDDRVKWVAGQLTDLDCFPWSTRVAMMHELMRCNPLVVYPESQEVRALFTALNDDVVAQRQVCDLQGSVEKLNQLLGVGEKPRWLENAETSDDYGISGLFEGRLNSALVVSEETPDLEAQEQPQAAQAPERHISEGWKCAGITTTFSAGMYLLRLPGVQQAIVDELVAGSDAMSTCGQVHPVALIFSVLAIVSLLGGVSTLIMRHESVADRPVAAG